MTHNLTMLVPFLQASHVSRFVFPCNSDKLEGGKPLRRCKPSVFCSNMQTTQGCARMKLAFTIRCKYLRNEMFQITRPFQADKRHVCWRGNSLRDASNVTLTLMLGTQSPPTCRVDTVFAAAGRSALCAFSSHTPGPVFNTVSKPERKSGIPADVDTPVATSC